MNRAVASLGLGLLWLASAGAAEAVATEQDFATGGGEITVVLAPELKQPPADVLAWVHRAADAVTGYYGRFPVPALRLVVRARPGEPVNSGSEHEGRRILIALAPSAGPDDLRRDWMLTHEMFHLGFPSLRRDYHYMEEGLSDYLEPLARARQGQITAQRVWQDFVDGIPQGLPGPGDHGLDGTRDWGRTYWGGCLFWLQVDLDIRERSGNTRSLDDAIRAIVAAGGTGDADWPLERMMTVGDRATGTGSIARLHALYGTTSADPQPDRLWRRLGIREDQGRVIFDENAPWAGMRRSMTAP
jgi:hypothetical protein